MLVNLKRRIQGDFPVVEEMPTGLCWATVPVRSATRCWAGLMCMMTSNVFGHIAADNLGYARVELRETIAQGHPGCRVVVHLKPSGEPGEGREYFRSRTPQ